MNHLITILLILIALAALAGVVRYTYLRKSAERVPRAVRIAAALAAVLVLGLIAVQTLRPFAPVGDVQPTLLQPVPGPRPTALQDTATDGSALMTLMLVRVADDSLSFHGDLQASELLAVTQVRGTASELVGKPVTLEATLGTRDSLHVTVMPSALFHTWHDDPTSPQQLGLESHPEPWFSPIPTVGIDGVIMAERRHGSAQWATTEPIGHRQDGSIWWLGSGWEPRRTLQLGGCRVRYGLMIVAEPLTGVAAVCAVPIRPAVSRLAASGLAELPLPELFSDLSTDEPALALAAWSGMTGLILIGVAMLGACAVSRWSLAFGINVLAVLVFASLLDRVAIRLELGRIGHLATPAELAQVSWQTLPPAACEVSDWSWELATARASFFHQQAAHASVLELLR